MSEVVNEAGFWTSAATRGEWSGWDDTRIRRECAAGTKREWAALARGGYVSPVPDAPEPIDLIKFFKAKKAEGGHITCLQVARAVTEKYHVTVQDMANKHTNGKATQKKISPIILAKRDFAYICCEILGLSYARVGRFLDNDRTTIRLHHIRACKLFS